MNRSISVIFSSHLGDEYDNKFIDHLKKSSGLKNLNIVRIVNNNEYSLTKAYNIGWNIVEKAGKSNDIIVFCHNDIEFLTKNWGYELLKKFNNHDYDILGIAGSDVLLKHGCWWLDESSKMNSKHMFGRVWHTDGTNKWESVYSDRIVGVKDCVVVDGLFFAIDGYQKHLKKFDESFNGYHYYDVSFSFQNFLNGMNIGVIDNISVLHKSVGQTNQEWEKNRIKFVEKYGDELPVKI